MGMRATEGRGEMRRGGGVNALHLVIGQPRAQGVQHVEALPVGGGLEAGDVRQEPGFEVFEEGGV